VTIKVIDASALAAIVFDEPALLSALPGLAAETLDVDQDAVVRLAVQTGLTTYDASYLWLANDLGIELVTLDRRLATAVEKFR
jgi:predicted nucleic acid-binding protein